MSDKQNIITDKKKKDNKKEEIENINDLNSFLNSKEFNISSINIDKEQLFKSFLLFQKFLTNNQNIIKENKTIDKNNNEKIIENKEISLKNKNSKKLENIKFNKEENKEKNMKDINNQTHIQKFDEIPIKSTGYNFEELLEKTLAKEENIKKEDKNSNIKDKNTINNKETPINNNLKENSSKEKEKLISTNENSNKLKSDSEKDVKVFQSKEIDNLEINNNLTSKDVEITNKADIIKKEINKVNIIKIENENNNNRDNIEKKEEKINNGKEIPLKTSLNEINFNTDIIDTKNIESKDSNELDILNEVKENINININKKTLVNNNKLNNKNDNNFKVVLEKNILNENLENGSILNKDKLIQKKIKELNSEIIKFKEEKAIIIKLKKIS